MLKACPSTGDTGTLQVVSPLFPVWKFPVQIFIPQLLRRVSEALGQKMFGNATTPQTNNPWAHTHCHGLSVSIPQGNFPIISHLPQVSSLHSSTLVSPLCLVQEPASLLLYHYHCRSSNPPKAELILKAGFTFAIFHSWHQCQLKN